MKSLLETGMWMAAALVATALASVTVAAENPGGDLQGSWNDYPAKWIQNSEIPNVTPPSETTPGDDPPNWIPPGTPPGGNPPIMTPPGTPPVYPPNWGPPRQQQQGKPGGGGFAWGGGKTGGKQGGSFSWGKTRPPQSQQGGGRVPGGGQANPNQAQMMEYIRALQAQNAQLRALLERLAGQQANNDGRSPGMPSDGVPLQ